MYRDSHNSAAAAQQISGSGAIGPVAMSQIDSCMNRLATVIDGLHVAADELAGRLQTLLNPVALGGEANASAAPELQRCPHGEALDHQSDRVVSAVAKLNALLDRLAI